MTFVAADICEVTLTGPASHSPISLVRSFIPWLQPEWRRITLHMQVGTDRWPNWDHVNLCLTAIQELISMADGLISDDVLRALRGNVDIIDIETLRGPPKDM